MMNAEERNVLLDLLFPSGKPSNDYELSLIEYIYKLGTYRTEDLIKEPNRLKEEKSVIVEHTQELATRNYKTFIQTADCSRQLFHQFNSIGNHVESLIENIPEFDAKCDLFRTTSNGINNIRKLNSVTLSKNAQILEILELPQLMDSFIKDNLYEDAFELVAYVRRLHNKHPDIPILETILIDVEQLWLVMLHQLLLQLRQDIQLPACLQIIGYLRRMDAFSEPELRLKFLQARDMWLRECLAAVPNKTKDSNYHLSKTIEISRVQLFNIVTQYKAIFNDDEHSTLAVVSTAGMSLQQASHLQAHNNINQNCILFSWINVKIQDFLTTLSHDIEECVSASSSIDSVLGQCMYFGLSFSKVGCDFRPLTVPIFTRAITSHFIKQVAFASREFDTNMERFTLINKNYPSWKDHHSAVAAAQTPPPPPDCLLEFYPFAEYLNKILTALNKLRVCTSGGGEGSGGVLIAAVLQVVECIERSLVQVSAGILRLYAQEHQAFTPQARDTFTRLCLSHTDHLVPYLQRAVHILFPQTGIASCLGVTAHSTSTPLSFNVLSREKLIEPIKHLLPVPNTIPAPTSLVQ